MYACGQHTSEIEYLYRDLRLSIVQEFAVEVKISAHSGNPSLLNTQTEIARFTALWYRCHHYSILKQFKKSLAKDWFPGTCSATALVPNKPVGPAFVSVSEAHYFYPPT